MPEYTFSSITAKTNPEKLFPLVVIDTETTGIKIKGSDIIEVSAIKFDANFVPVSSFSMLVNISGDVPQEITDITGITKEMISESPFFYQVKAAFMDFISGCNVAGHNLEFDMKFLYVNGVDFEQGKVKYFDTLQIAQKILKTPKAKYCSDTNSYEIDYDGEYDVENHKLETFIEAGTNIKADFCLKSKGDSMINARIQNGDIVFIRQQSTVENGEIAAVIIDDEATLKRVYYYPSENRIVLMPENPLYSPLVYCDEELNEIHILGKAIAFPSDVI